MHRGLLWGLTGHKIVAHGRRVSSEMWLCGTWTQHLDEVGVDGHYPALLAFAENLGLSVLTHPRSGFSSLRLVPVDGVPWEIQVIPDYYAYAAAKSAYMLATRT